MKEKPLILVTGANGQLGMELSELAVNFPQFSFYFTDKSTFAVHDKSAVMAWFIQYKPAYCINCAAYTAVDKAEEPGEIAAAFAVNADAPGYLAEAAAAMNARLIHISTDYVFDGKGDRPYTETDTTNPQGVYALSKLKGEEAALQHNPDTIVIRTSWLYSAYGKNFVKTIHAKLKEKTVLNVVNDQFGSPTYAASLSATIMQIISLIHAGNPVPGGIYHYCNQGVISWYEFALAIKELTGSSCEIIPVATDAYPVRAARPPYSALNTSRISSLPGVEILPWKDQLRICLSKL